MDKKTIGKKNRAQGKAFEIKVRKDLEEKGWICSKWSNNVEFEDKLKEGLKERVEKGHLPEWIKSGELIPAKSQYNPFFKRIVGEGSGFPDFIAYKRVPCRNCMDEYGLTEDEEMQQSNFYEVIGVEAKINGRLDKIEKEKCEWILDNRIFSKILIASKEKGKVIYTEFVSEN